MEEGWLTRHLPAVPHGGQRTPHLLPRRRTGGGPGANPGKAGEEGASEFSAPWKTLGLSATPPPPGAALPTLGPPPAADALTEHRWTWATWPPASPGSPESLSRPPATTQSLRVAMFLLIKTQTDLGFRSVCPKDGDRPCVCNDSQTPGKEWPPCRSYSTVPKSGRGLVPGNQAGRSLISVHNEIRLSNTSTA